MKLIDFHTHCFPDAIAERAVEKLAHDSGGLIPYADGTVNGLEKSMKQNGVSLSVVLNIATNAHQQKKVNDFASEINSRDGICAFGSVFPDAPDALYELERIKSLGLKGVKLHPEYQRFYVDDEKMKPLYKKISTLGLITVFHAGEDYGYAAPFHCMPDNLANALKWLDSPVVAAHFGGMGCSYEVLEKLAGLDVYFDTACSCGRMPRDAALRIVEKHTSKKILFGTDCPWSNAAIEMRLINSLGLSENEKNDICFLNAQKLLGIV